MKTSRHDLAALTLLVLVSGACSRANQPDLPAPRPAPTATTSSVVATSSPEVTTRRPWIQLHAEHPRALLDAMDRARGEAAGALARRLFGAAPGTEDSPLRAWIVGAPSEPSLWVLWPGAPASTPPGALLACDGAAHVCANRAAELPSAVAFARAHAEDARPQAAGHPAAAQGPSITATIGRATIEHALPSFAALAEGATLPAMEAIAYAFGREVRTAQDVREGLADVSGIELRWSVTPDAFVLDADVAFDPAGSSALASRLAASPSPDDGVALAMLARRCRVDAGYVIGARTRGAEGLLAVGLARLTENAAYFGDPPLERSLRQLAAASGEGRVICEAQGSDGLTIHEIVALRDPNAARRALRALSPHRAGSRPYVVLYRVGAGVVVWFPGPGSDPYTYALAVLDDALVIVRSTDRADKPFDEQIAALLASKPLPQAPLLGTLAPAPMMFGVDVAKVTPLRRKAPALEGAAVLRARVDVPAPGRARVTIQASPRLVRLPGDAAPALDAKPERPGVMAAASGSAPAQRKPRLGP